MLQEKSTPSEEDMRLYEERLDQEEEISKQVLEAREAGKTQAGGTRPIQGTGRKGVREKGPRPHDKPGRMDRARRETIRGQEPPNEEK